MQRAQAEQDLLDAGAAFSDALQSYAAATPQGQPPQPPGLQELLKDPRTPALRRHLRKIFVDPATGSTEWGIVYLGQGGGAGAGGARGTGGVVAVYSLSQARPLKIGNFDARFAGFDGKQHLSDWKFTAGAIAPVLPVAPAAAPPLIAASTAPVTQAAPAPAEPEKTAEEKPDDKTEETTGDKPEPPPAQ